MSEYHRDQVVYCTIVKLNNPLMGTETNTSSKERINRISNTVKLNNPLMGTETVHTVYCVCIPSVMMLN